MPVVTKYWPMWAQDDVQAVLNYMLIGKVEPESNEEKDNIEQLGTVDDVLRLVVWIDHTVVGKSRNLDEVWMYEYSPTVGVAKVEIYGEEHDGKVLRYLVYRDKKYKRAVIDITRED